MNELQYDYLKNLRIVYDAETRLIDVLPRITQSISSARVWNATTVYFDHVKDHVTFLNQLFTDWHTSAHGNVSDEMNALIQECLFIIDQLWTDDIQDIALITILKRITDYKSDAYNAIGSHLHDPLSSALKPQLDLFSNHEKEFYEQLIELQKLYTGCADTISVTSAENPHQVDDANRGQLPIDEVITAEFDNHDSD